MRASALCVLQGDYTASVLHAWRALLAAERTDQLDEIARSCALRAFLLSGIARCMLLPRLDAIPIRNSVHMKFENISGENMFLTECFKIISGLRAFTHINLNPRFPTLKVLENWGEMNC